MSHLKHPFLQLYAFVLLSLYLMGVETRADFIPPEQTSATTPTYSDVRVEYPSGKYLYDISWQGIPVASAELIVKRESSADNKSLLHITAKTRTASVIRLLYDLKHVSESLVQLAPFKALHFSGRQIENSRARYRSVEFGEDTVTGKLWKPGRQPEIAIFTPHNLTLDPLSAGVLALSVPVNQGSILNFDVYNGKHRFVITFTVEKEEEVNLGVEKIPAWKVIPTVKKLTDSHGEKRLRSAALWVSKDSSHRLLRLESKVLIGKVVAKLNHFEPANDVPTPSIEIRPRLRNPEAESFD